MSAAQDAFASFHDAILMQELVQCTFLRVSRLCRKWHDLCLCAQRVVVVTCLRKERCISGFIFVSTVEVSEGDVKEQQCYRVSTTNVFFALSLSAGSLAPSVDPWKSWIPVL